MNMLMWVFVLTMGYSHSQVFELTIEHKTEIECQENRMGIMQELYKGTRPGLEYWYITACARTTRVTIEAGD